MEGPAPAASVERSVSRRSRSFTPDDVRSQSGADTKVRRIEASIGATERMLRSLSAVSSHVMDTLRSRLDRVVGSRGESESRAMALEGLLGTSCEKRAAAELHGVQTSMRLAYTERAVEALEKRIAAVGTEAARAVSDRVQASTQAAVGQLTDRLKGEAQLTDALVQHVKTFVSDSLSVVEGDAQGRLQAELEASSKDVVIARLQTALSLELARHARYHEEVDALMRVVATLAERSQRVDSASEELARTRAQVRHLETYLDLNGIVAAIATPDRVPVSTAPAERPPMPSTALKARTPHYFALRVLEHKDMTLSELVDAWLAQEERVVSAETRYAELEGTVEAVRRDALLVHQQYLEERQRRELAERRITEMVRERVRGGRGTEPDSAVTELSQLRWAYAQVVDDAAQLAVSLKLAREELAEARKGGEALRQRMRQVEQEARTDEVAATLYELRGHYESTLESLRADYTDAELQRRVLVSVIDRQRATEKALREALELSRGNAANLNDWVQVSITNMNKALTSLQEKLDAQEAGGTASRQVLTEQVQRVQGAFERLQAQAKEFASAQDGAMHTFSQQVASLVSAATPVAQRESTKASADPSRSDAARRSGSGEASSASAEAVASLAVQEEMAMMRRVLADSMTFVMRQLEGTDAERTSLLDASISDAEYVTYLMGKLRTTADERDDLKRELSQARRIIDQNHLSLVERALAHEVSVQDSLDSAEAAERIATLQEQLTAGQLVRQAALEEIRGLEQRRSALEDDVAQLTRDNVRLREQCTAMTAALRDCHERERGLLASKVDMQSRVKAAVDSVREEEEEGTVVVEGEEGGADPTLPAPVRSCPIGSLTETNERLESLLQQFGSQLTTMTEAVRDAAAKKLTPSAGVDVTAAEAEGGGDPLLLSEQAIGEHLARSGLGGVVKLIAETLRKANLLKRTLESSATAATLALADAAGGQAELQTPEMLLASERKRAQAAEETVARLAEERTVMSQRLTQTETAVEKMSDANKRLLSLTKTLSAMKEAHTKEIRELRARVAELMATPSQPLSTPIEAPAATVAAADAAVDRREEVVSALPPPPVDQSATTVSPLTPEAPPSAPPVAAAADEAVGPAIASREEVQESPAEAMAETAPEGVPDATPSGQESL